MTSRRGTHGPGVERSPAVCGALAYPAEVAPGTTVTWDPEDPYRCIDLTVADDEHHDTSVAEVDRLPWLRLAAVTVLDRQLYLPLDRSLLDAEVAAARLAAAQTLSTRDPLRERLVRRALVGARAASGGVASYLENLATDRRRPPPALATALDALVRCYTKLSDEVRGFDSALAAVVEAGRRLASTGAAAPARPTVVAPPAPAEEPHGVAQIDPRSLPARVLRFGPSCDAAEISVASVCEGAGPAVRVEVDAFSPVSSPVGTTDVGVRLIDRRSGSVRGYGLLGRPVDRGTQPDYAGLVSLPPSLAASDVRVDLFEVAAGAPPAEVDDGELRRTRRATLFLADCRALVADVRLWGTRAAPATRLRDVVRRLTDESSAEPQWSGGPTRSQLLRLAERGDRVLTGRLRDGSAPDDRGRLGIVEAVSGPGDLLVAEIAAAHERPRAASGS